MGVSNSRSAGNRVPKESISALKLNFELKNNFQIRLSNFLQLSVENPHILALSSNIFTKGNIEIRNVQPF
ncbi:Uncharacterized protein APZ42_022210 [Daphnia magna]|uniref:Uncharacterized protein n=1 Tax=Daphnia magna TaxID=35525 RepID=A0A164W4H0_9CRUS|nr:Uncharacterized protein APZ42_022210 [Daphnia magna]